MHKNELTSLELELINSIDRIKNYLKINKIKNEIDKQRANKTIINLNSHLHSIRQCLLKFKKQDAFVDTFNKI